MQSWYLRYRIVLVLNVTVLVLVQVLKVNNFTVQSWSLRYCLGLGLETCCLGLGLNGYCLGLGLGLARVLSLLSWSYHCFMSAFQFLLQVYRLSVQCFCRHKRIKTELHISQLLHINFTICMQNRLDKYSKSSRKFCSMF